MHTEIRQITYWEIFIMRSTLALLQTPHVLNPGFSVKYPASTYWNLHRKIPLNSKHQSYTSIFFIFPHLWYWKKIRTLCYPMIHVFKCIPGGFCFKPPSASTIPTQLSIVPVTREAALLLLEPPWSENIPTLRPTHFSMKRLDALQ